MSTPETESSLAAGEALFARAWRFERSVPALEHLPAADRPEVAFAGRSNVGKSSLLNALMRHKGLARTSNTPGRTQELNFFTGQYLAKPFWLVDMPGYGFAKAPKEKVEAWTDLVKSYLRGRSTLARVYLLIDARHGVKPIDREVMELLDEAAVIYQLVLTKADKISVPALAHVEAALRDEASRHGAAFPEVIATSAETGDGVPELRQAIAAVIDSR